MQFEEWMRLTPEEQKAAQVHWNGKDDSGTAEWHGLIREATRRMELEYGHLPDVIRFEHSAWFSEQFPVHISVATRLSCSQQLAELPSDYAGFTVQQEAIGDDIQAHKDTWSAILTKLFDWDQSMIVKFIAGQDWVWNSPWFLHDYPIEHLPTIALVQSKLKSWRNYQPQELYSIGDELIRAIGEGEGWKHYLHDAPNYDWDAARKRIASVIQRHERTEN